MAIAKQKPCSCVLVSQQNKILLDEQNVFIIEQSRLSHFMAKSTQRFHLSDDLCLYQVENESVSAGFRWASLREMLGVLSEQHFQLAGRALQISRWQINHRYCGRCGAFTSMATDEFRLDCKQCGMDYFPRISPCVIGLVKKGEYCLLASGVRHPETLFSTLAGFIEVGESAEQAFVREVKEEVNIDIHNLQYAGSQPWPFPGQLMIGFTADYLSGDIVIDPKEIVEAGWFRYDNLPNVPPEHSIAGQLIKRFVKSHR